MILNTEIQKITQLSEKYACISLGLRDNVTGPIIHEQRRKRMIVMLQRQLSGREKTIAVSVVIRVIEWILYESKLGILQRPVTKIYSPIYPGILYSLNHAPGYKE